MQNTFTASPSQRATERTTDPMELFYRQIVDLLRRPVPAAGPDAISLLIYVGPADLSGIQRTRASLPPSTFLLWLYPPDDAFPRMPEQPLEGTRTVTCPLAEGVFYSDRIGLLIAIIPERKVELRVASELEALYVNQISKIKTAIRAAIENHSNHATRGLIRLRCSLQNLPAICGPTSQIPLSVPVGCSAIVCGAGPSLSSQMEILRRVADRVTIIAVGHAVPALIGAGIMPHIVVEGDSMAYQNWPADLRLDSLLVALAEVSPEVANRFSRILWCHGCSLPFKIAATNWGLPLHEVTLNKTVTVQAIDFAVRLGFDRLALVGQDLSLSETGQMHAEGDYVDSNERRISLPGNEGRQVMATMDLAALHEAIEKYLIELGQSFESASREILICNCTHGGAVIGGTVRMTLELFTEGIPSDAQRPIFHKPTSAVVPPLSPLTVLSAGLQKYIAVARDVVRCCTQLRRDLEIQPLNADRVRRRQDELQVLIQQDKAVRADKKIGLWVNFLLDYVDQQMKNSPELVSDAIDPHVQLRFLHTRYDMAANLCAEIRYDIDRAIATWASTETSPVETSPYIFNTFRRQNLHWIGAQNKALSHFLERGGPGSAAHRFKIHWINQVIPYVKIAQPPDSWVPLNSFASMYDQSRADVSRFLKTTHFLAGQCGVTCVVPGNWAHVIELAIRFPSVSLIVIDPWLDLLSAMIERGLFLHRLPPHTLILGVHEKLRDWEELYCQKVREWNSRGIRNILWVHPRISNRSDISELFERVKTLSTKQTLENVSVSLRGGL